LESRHGLSADVEQRAGDREATRECLKRIANVSVHVRQVDERLKKLEERLSQEQLAAFVDSRIQGLLDLQRGSPEAKKPGAPLTPPEATVAEDEAKKPAHLEIVAVADAQDAKANGATDDKPLSRTEKKARKKQIAAMMPDSANYEFGDSLWDAALFIGSRSMTTGDSLLVALLLLITIFIQIMFLFIVYYAFILVPFFDDGLLDGLTAWRLNIGHNVRYFDQLTMTSLVERICNPDRYVSEVSSGTSSIIGAIDDYKGDNELFSGPMLVKVAMVLWGLTVAREITTCWDLARAIRALPHGITSVEHDDGGAMKWTSISGPRAAWCYTICIFRIGCGALLWVLGNIFLCTNTITTGDILLNAVALEIVLCVAEAMFALVPSRVKKLLRSLDEMPAQSRFCRISNTDLRPALFFVALAAMVVTMHFLVIVDVVQKADAAKETLCGGNTGFVYSMDPFFLVYTTETNPHNYDTTELDKFPFKEAILEAVYPETIPMHPLEVNGETVDAPMPMALHFETNGLGPVRERSAWGMEESAVALMQHHGVACEDSLHSLTFARRFLVEAGINFGEIPETTSVADARCPDVEHMCMTWPLARAVCPTTCGCSEPLGTLFLSHPTYGCARGCTEEAHSEYRTALAELECTERTPAQLQNDATWKEWSKQVGAEIDAVFRSEPQLKPSDDSEKMMLEMGCAVIPFWIDAVKTELDMVVDPCVGNWLEEWLETKALAPACPITCGCDTKSTSDEDWFASHCSEKCAVP